MTTEECLKNKDVYSPAEAADYLGIGKTLAYAIFREPGFPCFRIGHRKFVMKNDMCSWLKKNGAAVAAGKEGKANG